MLKGTSVISPLLFLLFLLLTHTQSLTLKYDSLASTIQFQRQDLELGEPEFTPIPLNPLLTFFEGTHFCFTFMIYKFKR